MSKPKKDRKPKAAKKGKRASKKSEPAVDLAELRKPVEEARTGLAAAEVEAKNLTETARALVAGARGVYHSALAPYRVACRKAGAPCEYEGGRGKNVSEKVSFEVEKVAKGVRVAVKGKPGTEEVIPLTALKESVNKAAYAYTDKYVGPRSE